MYECTMYEGCMIYRFAGFPIYAADNRPFKKSAPVRMRFFVYLSRMVPER